MKRLELTGQKFGRLLVVGFSHTDGHETRWTCRCDCGALSVVRGTDLRSGNTQSCDCLRREKCRNRLLTHGEGKNTRPTPEYRAWQSMLSRCRYHPDYAGRGIKVCPRWQIEFSNFLADMGRRPTSSHSLDRINNAGGYNALNCRWATKSEQALNRRPKRASSTPVADSPPLLFEGKSDERHMSYAHITS